MKYFSTPQNKTLGEATDSELWQEINRREQNKVQERSVGVSYRNDESYDFKKDLTRKSTWKAPGIMKPPW